jgi:hypothetical protein
VEKKRNDLDTAGVKDVNVALILQGIRVGAAKRRNEAVSCKSWEFSKLRRREGGKVRRLDVV